MPIERNGSSKVLVVRTQRARWLPLFMWLVTQVAGLTMLGCASGSGSTPPPTPSPTPTPAPTPTPTPSPAKLFLTPGNWSITGTSATSTNVAVNGAGDVTQSGNNVPGLGVTISDPSKCFGSPNLELLTGIMSGSTLTLTNTSASGSITIVLTGNEKQLSGTYQITGGCLNLEHGVVNATFVPSVTGTWKGSLTSTTGAVTQATATLTQGPSSDPTGFQFYPISGNVDFSGTPCIAAGTVDPAVSFIRGIGVEVQNISDRVPPNPRSVNFLTGIDAPAGTTLSGTYSASGGSCGTEMGTVTLVRQ